MQLGVEIWRGSVNTWECDSMGHMNVRFYVAKAMDALVGFAAELGMTDAFHAGAKHTLLPRQQHIRFLKETMPHAPLMMTGAVAELGETEARLLFLLHHATGELAASFITDVAHVAADSGAPEPWPTHVRERARALKAEIPPGAAPRSLDLEAFETGASLARAEALGLQRLFLGPVNPPDCDAFGRMRAEFVIGHMSDGMPHILKDAPESPVPTEGIGGAAIEYRVVHFRWPRSGDRLDLRSGWAQAHPRIRKQIHWMLDPASGEPWAVVAAIFVAIDRANRRLLVLDDDQLAGIRAKVVEGLAL